MEHDDEMNIREKINSLDSTPIAWDKDLVWSSIQFHGTRPSQRIFVYYAAASLILATAIVFYSVERTTQETLRVRLGEIDLALKQTLVQQPVNTTRTLLAEVPCERPEKVHSESVMVAQQKRHTKPKHTIQMDSKQVPMPAPIADSPLEKTAAPEMQTTLIAPNTQVPKQTMATHEVPVILGKSIVASSDQQETRKGRLSLRLFRTEDEKSTTPTATPIVTLGGINN